MKRQLAESLGSFVVVVSVLAASTAASATSAPSALLAATAAALSTAAALAAFGSISGGHFNPAITVGLAAAGRFAWRRVPAYLGAQLLGAVLAAGTLLFWLKSRTEGYDVSTLGLAANGFGDRSPGHYDLLGVLVAEAVLAFVFVSAVLGAGDKQREPAGKIAVVAAAYALVVLLAWPISGAGLNPARSTGAALFAGSAALGDVWVFWLAPLAGAVLAGGLSRWTSRES